MAVLSAGSIARAAYGAGFRGEALVTAVAVALGESGGDAAVVNSIGCVGLWQINQPVHVRAHPTWTRAWCQDPANNAAAAWVLSSGGTNWGPWVVYTTGAYKSHLGAARAAAGGATTASTPTTRPDGSSRPPVKGGQGPDGKKKPKKDPDLPPEPDPLPPATTTDPDPRVRLGWVYLHGGSMTRELSEAVTSASVSWGTDAVTQLTLAFEDPGFELYRTGLFATDVAMLYRDRPGTDAADGLDLSLRIASTSLDGGQAGTGGMQVMARSEGVWKLKRRRGALVMRKSSPSDFVAAECKKAGLRAVVQPSAKRGQVARDVAKKGKADKSGADKPSSWTTFQRLASELGYVVFEFADVVYFGKPTWLIARDKVPLQVALPLEGAPEVWATRTMPTINHSTDAENVVEVSGIELDRARFSEVRPGGGLHLRGLPPFNERYLITAVSMPLLGTGPIELTASTPVNPAPQPPAKKKRAAGASSLPGGYDPTPTTRPGTTTPTATTPVGPTTGKSALAFVNTAISASNASYVFGAEASAATQFPSALDCSELVQWALARIGVPFVDGSSAQYAACRKISVEQAFNTRGALLWKSGHIGISMGNGGGSVEARNPSAGVGIFNGREIAWVGGGLVPGLAYG